VSGTTATPATINTIKVGDGVAETLPGTYYSPWVAPSTVYGATYSATLAATATTNYTEAADTTLVVSPLTAACSSCHDSNMNIAHYRANGGTFYETRAVAKTRYEQCSMCHSAGKVADPKTVHITFK